MMLGFLLALIGFLSFALAMNRHYHQLFHRTPPSLTRWLLRAVGATGVALSLLVCADHLGWSVGSVLWFGVMTIAALAVIMLFAYGPVSGG